MYAGKRALCIVTTRRCGNSAPSLPCGAGAVRGRCQPVCTVFLGGLAVLGLSCGRGGLLGLAAGRPPCRLIYLCRRLVLPFMLGASIGQWSNLQLHQANKSVTT